MDRETRRDLCWRYPTHALVVERSVEIGGKGGNDQIDEDAVAGGARHLGSSVVDDNIFGAFAEDAGCRAHDTTTFHDISSQFREGDVVIEFSQATYLLPVLIVIVRQIQIDNLGKLLSVAVRERVMTCGERLMTPVDVNRI